MKVVREGGSNDPVKREVPLLQDFFVDGARRIRTADLLGAIQALCQLSYSPEIPDLQGKPGSVRVGPDGKSSLVGLGGGKWANLREVGEKIGDGPR